MYRYKAIDIYSPELINAYKDAAFDGHTSGMQLLPPHPFAIAARAYHNALFTHMNQSILIRCIIFSFDSCSTIRFCSGESGSGKTETSKRMLMFFSEISNIVKVIK